MKKVMAVTGGRADWSLLQPVLAGIRDSDVLSLQLVVTGQHLDAFQEKRLAVLRDDGFTIDATIPLPLDALDAANVTAATAAMLHGMGPVLASARPDLLLVLGDRYEIMAAAQAAVLANIPIAHLCGGDVSEGAIDDVMRHAITKMAHLHFVTNDDAAARVRQMGENPAHVYQVGSPGLDNIRLTPPMSRDAFFASLDMPVYAHFVLVTFHPVTLEQDSGQQFAALLRALESMGKETAIIMTGTNADAGAAGISAQLHEFAARHDHVCAIESLGAARYYSALAQADMVIGNSSSGLYEAPSFGIPTINIGNRQKGRLKAASVIDSAPDTESIIAAIEQGQKMDCRDVVNPYGDGYAADRIIRVLEDIPDLAALLHKSFFDFSQEEYQT